MRYSLRTLLIVVLVVSLLFGGIVTYNSVWQNHCRKLESSLCRHIVMDQRKQAAGLVGDNEEDACIRVYNSMSHIMSADSTLYVAIGHAGSDDLSPISPEFLEEFDDLNLAPFTYSTGQRRRFYLHIVRWINWTTVVVDHNSADNPLTGRAVEGTTYRYKDGTWELVEDGSYWVT